MSSTARPSSTPTTSPASRASRSTARSTTTRRASSSASRSGRSRRSSTRSPTCTSRRPWPSTPAGTPRTRWTRDLPDAPLAVSVAKSKSSDTARDVTAAMIQFHGGIGYTWEHDAHLFFKRAKREEYAVRRRHVPPRADRPAGRRWQLRSSPLPWRRQGCPVRSTTPTCRSERSCSAVHAGGLTGSAGSTRPRRRAPSS